MMKPDSHVSVRLYACVGTCVCDRACILSLFLVSLGSFSEGVPSLTSCAIQDVSDAVSSRA